MEEMSNILSQFGADTLIIALAINFATGVFKMPIKHLSKKLCNDSINIKKYITLMPFLFGFIFTSIFTYLFFDKGYFWNDSSLTLALTSSSLSFAVYAVCEKFFSSVQKQDILKQDSPNEKKSHEANNIDEIKIDDDVKMDNDLDVENKNIEKRIILKRRNRE